ncbi:MAG: substrate-binding domain-containing protein, partial [Lachnospiraceae bacterium]|nr:substrate-binding domain-containing protein [Lachnospiraceae bacterium]
YYAQEEIEAYINHLTRMPEAIVCANDVIAFLVVKALRARGLLVPEDVAVTGFDNQEELSRMDPFLTTVRVGNTRLGKRLACQLLFRLKNPELPQEVVTVDTKVVYRESSRKYNTP